MRAFALVLLVAAAIVGYSCTPQQQRAARTAAQVVAELAEAVCAADDSLPVCLAKCEVEAARREEPNAGDANP
jgi:hypothetical protein